MNIQKLKSSPTLFSIIVLISIFLFFQIFNLPIDFKIISRSLIIYKIIGYLIVIIFVILLIKKIKTPISFFDSISPVEHLYYLPVLLSMYIFTGGFQDISTLSNTDFYTWRNALFGIEKFSQVFLEELLFRGLILGLLIEKYYKSKNGILKSVFISSLIFGLIHLVNNWTQPNQFNVVNQIYAAFCLGVLLAAVYLRTRSLIMITLFHFGINFFGSIDNFDKSGKAVEAVNQTGQSMGEITITVLFIIIFFGIPLFLGLLVLRKYNVDDVEKLFQS